MIFFFNPNDEETKILKDIIDMTKLLVRSSIFKNHVFFLSSNTSPSTRHNISSTLGVSKPIGRRKYLELPFIIGHKKKK